MSEDNTRPVARVVLTGFGPFKDIVVNPSFQIVQALPDTLKIYTSKSKPQTIQLLRHPDAIHVAYETVVELIPQLYDLYASEDDGLPPPYFIHIGAGYLGQYELESLAHRDDYSLLDVDGKSPPLQNAEFLAGSRVAGQKPLGANVPRGFPVFDQAAEPILRTSIDVNALAEAVRRDLPDLPMPVNVSTDAGHYLCDFIYYTSLHQAVKRFGEQGTRRVLFVHVPPNGTLEDGVRVLGAVIRGLVPLESKGK